MDENENLLSDYFVADGNIEWGSANPVYTLETGGVGCESAIATSNAGCPEVTPMTFMRDDDEERGHAVYYEGMPNCILYGPEDRILLAETYARFGREKDFGEFWRNLARTVPRDTTTYDQLCDLGFAEWSLEPISEEKAEPSGVSCPSNDDVHVAPATGVEIAQSILDTDYPSFAPTHIEWNGELRKVRAVGFKGIPHPLFVDYEDRILLAETHAEFGGGLGLYPFWADITRALPEGPMRENLLELGFLAKASSSEGAPDTASSGGLALGDSPYEDDFPVSVDEDDVFDVPTGTIPVEYTTTRKIRGKKVSVCSCCFKTRSKCKDIPCRHVCRKCHDEDGEHISKQKCRDPSHKPGFKAAKEYEEREEDKVKNPAAEGKKTAEGEIEFSKAYRKRYAKEHQLLPFDMRIASNDVEFYRWSWAKTPLHHLVYCVLTFTIALVFQAYFDEVLAVTRFEGLRVGLHATMVLLGFLLHLLLWISDLVLLTFAPLFVMLVTHNFQVTVLRSKVDVRRYRRSMAPPDITNGLEHDDRFDNLKLGDPTNEADYCWCSVQEVWWLSFVLQWLFCARFGFEYDYGHLLEGVTIYSGWWSFRKPAIGVYSRSQLRNAFSPTYDHLLEKDSAASIQAYMARCIRINVSKTISEVFASSGCSFVRELVLVRKVDSLDGAMTRLRNALN